MKSYIKAVAGVVAAALLAPMSYANSTDETHNIIYLIGDGMGPAHTTAYRYYKASKKQLATGDTTVIAPTEFDRHLVGMASTYPADNTLVTDSAAGATALATGHKSYNGAIGITPDHEHQETLLERAKKLGMVTGVVSTSQINHATPASFIAHIDSRRKYDEIADQYVETRINGKIKSDIMLGGGTQYYRRDNRDIVAEFKKEGVDYIDALSDLDKLTKLPAMGLFAPKGLPFEVDSHEQPKRLTRMTKKALELADSSKKNFFLMIEGSQIDWCSHANDIACAMKEMEDFESTLKTVVEFARKDGNTTVVVTADHSTGGLTLGVGKGYSWLAHSVHKIRISGESFAVRVMEGEKPVELWNKYVDLPLEKEEQKQLEAIDKSAEPREVQKLFVGLTAKKTDTGWTTSGHTAEDVQVYAFGPNADKFVGFQDNTDIAKKLFNILGK